MAALAEFLSIDSPAAGLQRLCARFQVMPMTETYAVGVTEAGLQCFHYRGAAWASTTGQVIVLYPDEVHDGHAGAPRGSCTACFMSTSKKPVEFPIALFDAARPLVVGKGGADMVGASALACSSDFLLRLAGCQRQDLVADEKFEIRLPPPASPLRTRSEPASSASEPHAHLAS
jgi:AraC-like ligand binding domain